jgi:nucleotide-binding universal stress UspA family protein
MDLANELGMSQSRSILVGVDGSPSSLNAGSYAAGLARRQSSQLVVVYVRSRLTFPATLAATAGIVLPAEDDEYASELERMVRQRAADFGVAMVFLHRAGDPYEELVETATELRADAVVVGASHHVGHRVVGSLAVRLVRHARWPVTVVP